MNNYTCAKSDHLVLGKQSSNFKAKLSPASDNWWRIISGPGKMHNIM